MNKHLTTLSIAILMSSTPALAQGLQFQSPAAGMVQTPMAGLTPTMGSLDTPLRAEVQNRHRYNENEVTGEKIRAQNQERIHTQNKFNRNQASGNSVRSGAFGRGQR